MEKTINNLKKINAFADRYHAGIILLGLAFVITLMSQNNQTGFLNTGQKDFVTAHGLAIGRNISRADTPGALPVEEIFLNTDTNEVDYKFYAGAPPLFYWILAAGFSAVPESLSMQIMIARQITNIFFLMAMLFAFLIVRLLSKSELLSAAIVLFVFGSAWLQYYRDLVFNDIPALASLLMVVYLIIVYIQNRDRKSFYYLLFGVVVSAMIGWQVFSAIGVFFIYEIYYSIKNKIYLKHNKYLIIGLAGIAVVVVIVLSYAAVQSNVNSVEFDRAEIFLQFNKRIGDNNHLEQPWNIGCFFKTQLFRLSQIIYTDGDSRNFEMNYYRGHGFKWIWGLFLILLFTGLMYFKRKESWAKYLPILAFSGFIWALLVRQFVHWHPYEAIFYAGFALAFIYLISKVLRLEHIAFVLVAAAFCFYITSYMTYNSRNTEDGIKANMITDEFQKINDTLGEQAFIHLPSHNMIAAYREAVDGNTKFAANFYLSGHVLSPMQQANYIVDFCNNSTQYKYNLSPENNHACLFTDDLSRLSPLSEIISRTSDSSSFIFFADESEFFHHKSQNGAVIRSENILCLRLNNAGISDIDWIKGNSSITCLELKGNSIKNIMAISELRELTYLALSENEIDSMQPLSQLTNLEHMYLNGNNISGIPDLGMLENLRYLDLSGNKISSIKGIDKLPDLKHLNLSGNRIEKIENVDTIFFLRSLSLNDNKISKLQGVCGLVNLRNLSLNNNNIEKIENISCLESLFRLNLASNEIQRIENLDLPYLERLALSHNEIETLDGLHMVPRLCKLELSHNNIKQLQFSNVQGLNNITELDLSFNQLDCINGISAIPKINALNLSGNPLSPSCCDELEELESSGILINEHP